MSQYAEEKEEEEGDRADEGVEHLEEEKDQDETDVDSELQGETEPDLKPSTLSLQDPRSRIA